MHVSPTEVKNSVEGQTKTKGRWLNFLEKRFGTFLLTAILGLLTVFSDTLTERIKFSLDRASLREEKFGKLSDDLSMYLFDCELLQKFLAEGDTKEELDANVSDELNDSITRLRGAEYTNRAIITRYWDAERAKEFEEIMDEVKNLDDVFHELNRQPKDKFTPPLESKVSTDIKLKLDPLRNKVQSFLLNLQ
jgi:hypothetical protein